MFHRHVRKLFQNPSTLGIPVSPVLYIPLIRSFLDEKKQEILNNPISSKNHQVAKEAVVRQREEFMRSLGWKKRLWVKIKTLHKNYSDWHAPLEGRDSFFYPQRFVLLLKYKLYYYNIKI
jgi:hypothetical protein